VATGSFITVITDITAIRKRGDLVDRPGA